MQSSYRPENRRARRSSSEDSEPPSPYFKVYLCCDIVNRMREDINCLCQDAKRLARNRTNLETIRKNFEVVCSDVRQKLRTLPYLKKQSLTPNLTEMKAIETRDFLKYTWSLANSCFDRKSKKNRFMSIRGISAIDYIKELVAICDTIQMKYGNDFHHVECLALYSHLTRQLQSLLVPEMFKGDLIEFSTHYIGYAMPAMINFISIIDLYVNNQRVVDLNGLYNEIFYPGPPVSQSPCKTPAMRMLSSLLRGDLLGEEPVSTTIPVVEGRATNFYQLAEELAHYILQISQHPPAQLLEGPHNILGPGLLDPRFLNSLPAPRTSPPETLTSEQPSPTPLVTQPTVARLATPRGRGRPRKRAMHQSDRLATNDVDLPPVRRMLF